MNMTVIGQLLQAMTSGLMIFSEAVTYLCMANSNTLKFMGLRVIGFAYARSGYPSSHVIAIMLRLVRPGVARAIVAESVLAKHQLLISQPIPPTRPKPPHFGSNHCRFLFTVDSA